MTPIISINVDHVLYGSGARHVAATDGIVTLKPVADREVSVRVPRRATSLRMSGGESLSITVAAGDVIELV